MIFTFTDWSRRCRAMVLASFLVGSVIVTALEVPRLQGRVNDYANLLSPQTEQALDNALAQLEQQDSTQVVVLTIPSLKGAALEEYSLAVAEAWKIGQKKQDNGAIFLVAKDDRKMRIEVGYGLEGRLTDLLTGRILDQEVRPLFRAGKFEAGIVAGTASIIKAVKGEYKASARSVGRGSRRRGSRPGNGVFFLLFLMMVFGSVNRKAGGVAGAILLPLMFWLLVGPGFLLLLLMPVGLLLGLGAPSMLRGRRGIFYGGGGGSGFGGGFSGGGGGFGGGGSSGSW